MTLVQAIKAAARWYATAQGSKDFPGVSVYRRKDTYRGWDWLVGEVGDRDADCVCYLYPATRWKDRKTKESIEKDLRHYYEVLYYEYTSHFKK